jgi:hypothetical protein
MEDIAILYDHFVYFTATLVYTVCGHLVYFVHIWYDVPRKIWQPCHTCVCLLKRDLCSTYVHTYSYQSDTISMILFLGKDPYKILGGYTYMYLHTYICTGLKSCELGTLA